MRVRPICVAAGVALSLAATVTTAEAQRDGRVRASTEIGLRAGRDFFSDAWTAGAHLRIPFARTIELRPSADVALDDPGDDFQINGDIALHGPQDRAYLGAGVGYVNRQFASGEDSGTGINLFLGFKPIPRRGSQIYLEGRWTFVNSETMFRVSLGVAFRL
jgi:hypothetical protein